MGGLLCRCSCCGAVLLLLRPVLLLLLVLHLLIHPGVLVHAVHCAVPGWLRADTALAAACPEAQPPHWRLARHVIVQVAGGAPLPGCWGAGSADWAAKGYQGDLGRALCVARAVGRWRVSCLRGL